MSQAEVTKRRTFRPKDCKVCGESFTPNHGAQKYCGDECRVAGERETRLRWNEANAERLREYGRQYRSENREQIAGRMRDWYRDNADRQREYRRGYYDENTEIERARTRTQVHGKRAPGMDADFGPEDDVALRAATKFCPLCGCGLTDEPYRPNSKEIDHVLPLAVGGAHTHSNVRVVCRKCNRNRPSDGSDIQPEEH